MPNYDFIVLLWVVCNKNKNKLMFDQSGWVGEHIRCFCVGLFRTREISLHKHNSCVLHRLIKQSLVLVIVLHM